MNNDQATPKPIWLADYTPPAYRIETVDLRFDLDPATTRVTATDADFQAIEAVSAHEYFHNWTDNRITCRDWFQLSLKEGLTAFRDQQFSADMGSAPVKRIDDVPLLRKGLIGRAEEPICTDLAHTNTTECECVLEIAEEEQTFVFENVPERPIASLLRGFSAPVILGRDLEDETLRFQMAHDTDASNRWDAGQTLVRRRVIAFMADLDNGLDPKLPSDDAEAFRKVLYSEDLDDALKAEALTLPNAEAIGEDLATIEPDKLVNARDSFVEQLAEALEQDFASTYRLRANDQEYTLDAAAIGRRRLKNLYLGYLGLLDRDEYVQHAVDQINVERNMTDVIAGMRVLSHQDSPARDEVFNEFYDKWQHDPLVTDKWLALQATARRDNVIEDVKRLMDHPAFNRRNPNRIRALIGAFAMGNFEGFHRADGEGYKLLADFVIQLDPINPQIASRLVQAMIRWRRFDDVRQTSMRAHLRRIAAPTTISDNTKELVNRALPSSPER